MAVGDVEAIIAELGLEPHPEGGMYAETWRHDPGDGSRGTGTAIYYLLRAGESSWKHRVDAAEIWHYYAGDPVAMILEREGLPAREYILGPDLATGARPQVVVPAHAWQSARPLGAWTLMGCTVSPAFQFEGFVLAPRP